MDIWALFCMPCLCLHESCHMMIHFENPFNKIFRATNPYIYRSHDFTSGQGYEIFCWFYSESLEWFDRQAGIKWAPFETLSEVWMNHWLPVIIWTSGYSNLILKPLKVVMKIIDENGNDIIGTPNLKRGEEYQIQIDFAETIVDSYEEKMTHTPDSSMLYHFCAVWRQRRQ